MKLTCIIFLFFIFCVIAIGEMEDKEYKDFDLYTESSFLKNGKKFRATKLSLNQRKELRDILSKYDLFLEGRTENTFPFIGTLAIFRVAIDKKPYLLCMINNTNHIFAKKKIGREENKKKLFWIQEIDGNNNPEKPEIRIFESAALYLELEKFLERIASPVLKKE